MAPFEGLPCGLGARDTLRTEMGYPLHGHELGPDITPVMARSAWAVGWDKESFWGKEALVAQRVAKSSRRAALLPGSGSRSTPPVPMSARVIASFRSPAKWVTRRGRPVPVKRTLIAPT